MLAKSTGTTKLPYWSPCLELIITVYHGGVMAL